MPNSVLDAIKMGLWDYEPEIVEIDDFTACKSLPGSQAKLSALAERVSRGLPLWHPEDGHDADDDFR